MALVRHRHSTTEIQRALDLPGTTSCRNLIGPVTARIATAAIRRLSRRSC